MLQLRSLPCNSLISGPFCAAVMSTGHRAWQIWASQPAISTDMAPILLGESYGWRLRNVPTKCGPCLTAAPWGETLESMTTETVTLEWQTNVMQNAWRNYWVVILLLIVPGIAVAQEKAYEPGQVWTFQAEELNKYARIVIGKIETVPDWGPTVHVVIVGVRLFDVTTGQPTFTDLWHMPFSVEALDMSVIELERTIEVPEPFHAAYQQWLEAYNGGGDVRQFDLPVGLVLKNLRKFIKESAQANAQDGTSSEPATLSEQ